MKFDTNAPYKVPAEYEPKNKNFEPKTKPTSVIMIILGGIIVCAIAVVAIIGIIIGANMAYKAIRDAIEHTDTHLEEDVNKA